jgi:hypothetical protein
MIKFNENLWHTLEFGSVLLIIEQCLVSIMAFYNISVPNYETGC